jgi:hypothetical protein
MIEKENDAATGVFFRTTNGRFGTPDICIAIDAIMSDYPLASRTDEKVQTQLGDGG